jgi:hypothetical protein
MDEDQGHPEPGRPPDYREEFATQAEKLCLLGATDYELADFFEVSTRTIYRWKNTHEEFCQAVKVGKEKSDDRVERALFNRAVGYSFESEKVFQFQGAIIRADTVEHVPPDPGAAMNWLKNRKPDVWRDKIVQEHTGADGSPLVPIINLTGGPGSSSSR